MPPATIKWVAANTNFEGSSGTGRLGTTVGPVDFEDGSIVEGGRVLMRDEWNLEVYDLLAGKVEKQDFGIHKNRLSRFGGGTEIECALKSRGIRTLLFAGCNTNRCSHEKSSECF